MKKVLALLLTITILVSIMPVLVLAVPPTKPAEDNNYLTFTAKEAGSTVKLNTKYYMCSYVKYSTKTSLGSWSDFVDYDYGSTITLSSVGDKICFIAEDLKTDNDNHFEMTGKIEATGDVTSLTNGTGRDTPLSNNCYLSMFKNCSALTSSPNLPSTALASDCYFEMFYGTNAIPDCSNIDFTSATIIQSGGIKGLFAGTKLTDEKLDEILKSHGINNYSFPVTNLSDYCYQNMFGDCTLLTKAPKLPATTLAEGCYQNMFSNCTSLTQCPKLPATTLAYGCYEKMFYGTNLIPDCSNIDFTSKEVVQSGGLIGLFAGTKLTDKKLDEILKSHGIFDYSLPVTDLGPYCYCTLFLECELLTKAPKLPATTLAEGCYQNMFDYCTVLVEAPELPATNLADYCYMWMFDKCYTLTKAPELPATTLAPGCYNGMFEECTALVEAPELPATMANDCYCGMFWKCTALVEAPELPATTLADYCYSYMFQECTSLKIAPALPALK